MSPAELKYSILRLINYKTGASRKRFEKSVSYVTNPKKTSNEMICAHYMKLDDPSSSLALIEKRWHNDEMVGRLFKHGIIAFGSSDMSPEDALNLVRATMAYYTDFPYFAAIHTDVPHRLHAHFLLGMRNLKTGKKFSQSKDDLMAFRKHYHKETLRYGLLGLKDCCSSITDALSDSSSVDQTLHFSAETPEDGWNSSAEYSLCVESVPSSIDDLYRGSFSAAEASYTMSHNAVDTSQPVVSNQTDLVNGILHLAQLDFNHFFYQGFKGGLSNE